MSFLQDQERMTNACVDFDVGSWELYSQGYREAADRLALAVEAEGEGQDWLIYPILLLYRHYIELRLKQLALLYQALSGTSLALKGGHSLLSLWRTVSRRAFPPRKPLDVVDRSRIDLTTQVIKRFDSVDPKGDSFRYPHHLNGKPVRFGQPNIGIRSLRESMSAVAEMLEGLVCAIDYRLEQREESARTR